MSIYAILETLADEPGKNAKIAILTANADNALLKTVLSAALDLTVNYYIKQIPAYTTGAGSITLIDAITALNTNLATRKVTGHAARDFLKTLLESVDANDALILEKIIARDLRCGVQRSTVNKVFKNLIPEFPYMRCNLPKKVKLDEYSWKDGVYSQLKADGMYSNFNMTADGELGIQSRQGSDMPLDQFTDLVAEAKKVLLPNTQTHGELLVKRNGEILAREIGNGILNSVLKNGTFDDGDTPVYMVWDQISLNEAIKKGKGTVPYKKRYATLNAQVTDSDMFMMIETRIVHSYNEALEHYYEKLTEGLEGTVIKCATGPWRDGTSKFQCKMKLDVDCDLLITGFNPGKGKNANTFGSIRVESSCGQLVTNISGFTDKARKDINNRREKLIGTIVTATSNFMTRPTKANLKYSLFLPRFQEFRMDKDEADDLTKIIEQFDNAIKLPKS